MGGSNQEIFLVQFIYRKPVVPKKKMNLKKVW
jgi:hypothetical protein